MTVEKKDDGWPIPSNIGFEPFKKVVGAFYQKDAESKEVTSKTIANAVGMTIKSIWGPIRFLLAIKILEEDKTKGYKLTTKGAEYAKAVYKEDKDGVKNSCSEIINNSYLKTLVDYISVNKADLSVEGLYKFIRAEGKFPAGPGSAGMTAPYATGARTLLHIFNTAKIFPEGFDLSSITEIHSGNKDVRKKNKKSKSDTKKKSATGTKKKTNSDVHSDEMVNVNFDDFSISMRKGIDQATFNFIKTQIKSTLEFWETKFVQTENQSENRESGTKQG